MREKKHTDLLGPALLLSDSSATLISEQPKFGSFSSRCYKNKEPSEGNLLVQNLAFIPISALAHYNHFVAKESLKVRPI